MKNTIRIIPSPATGSGGASATQGTRLLVGDVEMTGVTRVTLRATVNDVWRAEIECFAQPAEVIAQIDRAVIVTDQQELVLALKALIDGTQHHENEWPRGPIGEDPGTPWDYARAVLEKYHVDVR